ncbi:MAG: PAS domain S-box protein [Flavisolibacter sp.]
MVNSLVNGAEEYLNLAAGIVIVIDADQTVRFINEKGCSLLEASREDIIGKNWFDHFVPEKQREKIRKLFLHMLQTKEVPFKEYESVVQTKKNNIRYISWYNSIISEEVHQPSGMLSLGEDITDKTMLLQRLSVQEQTKRQQLVSAVIDAQEKERKEIAAELHDNVNQILTTCKLLLEQEIYTGNKSSFIANTAQHLLSAINEIRNISHRLNPMSWEDKDFKQAVQDMVDKINLSLKLKVNVTIEGSEYLEALPSSTLLSIFRILQEQLSNIMKYAEATSVEINIDADENSTDFEVKDNGKGFNLKTVERGLGLRSIYSRAELHNGKVYINTAPGEGCILSVHIPHNF